MNVEKISKLAVKMALVLAGAFAGSSVTFVASQKKISKYKKTTKCAQDACEKALNLAELMENKEN